MYENNIIEADGNGESNLIVNSIMAGAAVAISAISYITGSMVGRHSAVKNNDRRQWVAAGNKKERVRIFGEQYDYYSALFADEDEEVVASNGRSNAKNPKN
jgi:hypothetical protein